MVDLGSQSPNGAVAKNFDAGTPVDVQRLLGELYFLVHFFGIFPWHGDLNLEIYLPGQSVTYVLPGPAGQVLPALLKQFTGGVEHTT